MRKTYLVTYEVKGEADPADYLTAFSRELKEFPGWWHYMKNTWLIRTDKTAQEIYEQLKPHIDENVNLLVIEVGRDNQGWLPKRAWEWIRKHVEQ